MTSPATVEDARASRSTDYDAIVLGAGISGLVSASVLLEQGARRILVVDEYERVGGNHIDRHHRGYTFDVGSFIFQDDSPLLAHFPELLPLYVPIDPSWAKLNPQRFVTRYPFSVRDDLLAAGPLECGRMLLSAGLARLRRSPLRNAKDFAQYWLGARLLHRSGLDSYMERFCGLPIDKIDLRFAEKRMLWIAEHARVSNQVGRLLRMLRRSPAPPPSNRQLARPRAGFESLYAAAVQSLEARGVVFALGRRPDRIDRADVGFVVHLGGAELRADRMVSTIPIDHARALCGFAPDQSLPTVTLISLFFSFSGRRGFAESILYNFSHQGAWKRLTTYSDFYGPHDGREYFGVEVLADQIGHSVEAAERDFRDHTTRNGLFDGELQLEGSHVLEHAYPIYTEGSGERAEQSIAELRAFGLESFGRQGSFHYQPTARVSTQEAESALRPA